MQVMSTAATWHSSSSEDMTSASVADHVTTQALSPYNKRWNPSSTAELLNLTSNVLIKYVGSVILVLGIVGNVLCIVIFNRKKLRSVQVTIFLRVLALVDLLLIVFGFGLYPDGPLHLPLVNTSGLACKVYFMLQAVLRSMSIWLVVCFNIERCIAITRPLKLKTSQAFGSRVIYGCIIGFFLVWTAYHVNILILFDLVPGESGDGSLTCNPVYKKSPIFIGYIRPWMSITCNNLVPFIIILLCNIRIMVELWRSTKLAGKRHGPTDGDGPDAPGKKGEVQRLQSIVVMLLTVSMVFLLLSSPLGLAMFLTRLFPPSYWWGSAERAALSNFMWKVALITMYLNSAINFILYLVSGRTFRREMSELVRELWGRCWRSSEQAGQGWGVSNDSGAAKNGKSSSSFDGTASTNV